MAIPVLFCSFFRLIYKIAYGVVALQGYVFFQVVMLTGGSFALAVKLVTGPYHETYQKYPSHIFSFLMISIQETGAKGGNVPKEKTYSWINQRFKHVQHLLYLYTQSHVRVVNVCRDEYIYLNKCRLERTRPFHFHSHVGPGNWQF